MRSSALWGKGGRGSVLAAVAVLALTAPVAASAKPATPPAPDRSHTWVQPELTRAAAANPNKLVRVIVQSSTGTQDAKTKGKALGVLAKAGRTLDLVDGVVLTLPAKLVPVLAKQSGLTITVDEPMRASGTIKTSDQLWPHATGNAYLWYSRFAADLPTIAVVDSGIDKTRADFDNGARVVADVNFVTPDPTGQYTNAAGDGRGHGTFVAGIAAGDAYGKAGAAPTAKIAALDVINDQGAAYTSDVIAAAQWILQNAAQYNIKVANFSLHSTRPSNFTNDPLDKAVEKLWFSGVTVVAAAGNYGNDDGTPSGVRYAPGNDPFVITVGAVDLGTSARTYDDGVAPWSAWGHTYDGFAKPEIGAPGRYMVGPVSAGTTIANERPDKVVRPGYMQLSGTSFAAPVVSGTAAFLLAMHPNWGPDQVKGALMKTARRVPLAQPGQAGVGELNAVGAARLLSAPNPNKALDQFVVADPNGGSTPVFDAISWDTAAKADISWDTISWDTISWDTISWDTISWDTISWDTVSWSDVSWSDISWDTVSWSDSAKEDAVLAEPTAPEAAFDTTAASDVTSDPDLNADPTLVDQNALDVLAQSTP